MTKRERIRIGRVLLIKTPASPNWYLEWSHEGKQYRRTTKSRSKKEADRMAKKLNAELELQQFQPPQKRRRKVTLGDAMRARLTWLTHNNRSPKTRGHVERHCRQLASVLPLGLDTRLEGVTVTKVDELVETLRTEGVRLPRGEGQRRTRGGKPLSDKTIRDILISIKSLTKFAVKRDLLVRDPLAAYELIDVPAKEREIFPPPVLRNLFDQPECGDVWKLLFMTCLRAREFTWLTRDDVMFNGEGKPRVLIIQKKTCPQTGKLWVPKHGTHRLVSLAPEAADIVERQLNRQSNTPWLFEASDSRGEQTGKWTYSPLLRRLHDQLNRMAHPRKGLHVFRHTGATFLANQANMPLAQLQKFLGHHDIKETMRYLHPDVEDISKSLDDIDYRSLTDDIAVNRDTDGRTEDDRNERLVGDAT